MVITNFVTKFGDKLVTKLGEHQIWCRIRWQIWWSKNSVRNMSLNIVNKLLTKFSPKFVTDFVIYLVITKFCDEFVTQFGVKFGDHHVWWQIWWQIKHQIGGSPNMVPKWSPKLVITKYVTKMFTKFGDKFFALLETSSFWPFLCLLHHKQQDPYQGYSPCPAEKQAATPSKKLALPRLYRWNWHNPRAKAGQNWLFYYLW